MHLGYTGILIDGALPGLVLWSQAVERKGLHVVHGGLPSYLLMITDCSSIGCLPGTTSAVFLQPADDFIRLRPSLANTLLHWTTNRHTKMYSFYTQSQEPKCAVINGWRKEMFHRPLDFKSAHLLHLFFFKCCFFFIVQWFCQSHGAGKYFPAACLESSIMCLWRMRHVMLHWIQGSVFLWFCCRSQSGIDFCSV